MNLQQVRRAVVCAALVALAAVAGGAVAIANDGRQVRDESTRFRAGVRNAPGRERLNADQLSQVLQSLREKTGWQALDFDEAGFLVCPDPQAFSGGSASARRLLGAALGGAEAYELEAHNSSRAVIFARVKSTADYVSHRTGVRLNARSVQLDFDDFEQLFGDRPAREAFDLGIAVLHELAHGVWKLRDAAQIEEEPGECETFINRIRRELRLPERQTYEARARSSRLNMQHGSQLIVELRFVHTQAQASPKRYRLQTRTRTY
jgi:hypothetical protein